MGKKTELWIGELKKGSYRESVARRYGEKGFTRRGTIKQEVIAKDVKSSHPQLRKKAVAARTLKKLQKKRHNPCPRR